MAEPPENPLQRPLPDGIVPEEVVARTEARWVTTMATMLVIMFAVIVVTGVAGALHPASNVETIDSRTLHLRGEFVESNLGTAIELDGSATVRMIAEQYDFVPQCVAVPAETPVKFRLTSAERHPWLPAPRYQRQYDGRAGVCRRGAHELCPAGVVPDGVQRVLRPRSSRHVDARRRRAERPPRGAGTARKDALWNTLVPTCVNQRI